jgi:hypothetical protein
MSPWKDEFILKFEKILIFEDDDFVSKAMRTVKRKTR